MKYILRHLSSFIAPIMMGIVIPYLIVVVEHPAPPIAILVVIGVVIGVTGLGLFIATVRMFIRIGNGTIMPWDPTRKLIVVSLYGYVRNPMILSLLLVLVGEALVFASVGIAALALFFFVLNTVYFKFSEEPGLVKRFGEEYVEYKRNVPRWIPRAKPWRPA